MTTARQRLIGGSRRTRGVATGNLSRSSGTPDNSGDCTDPVAGLPRSTARWSEA
jgi:hypothetical protein